MRTRRAARSFPSPVSARSGLSWKELSGRASLYHALKKQNSVVSLAGFLAEVRNVARTVDLVAIYAEIPELGQYLSKAIKAKLTDKEVLVFSLADGNGELCMPPVPVFHQRYSRSPLRMFVYGGPLSSYLCRKENRYLALDIEADGGERPSEDLETVLLLDDKVDDSGREDLRQYHRNLVEKAAALASCVPFYAVYRAFNEMAWLVQSRASFQRAEEFQRCIEVHHADPRPPTGEAAAGSPQ